MPDRILIVDDEAFNLDLLEQELTDRGYAVERARDGAEAVRKVESARPDLMLLDYMMPGMNGLDVLEAIRDAESDVPVVMMTAHGSIEVAVQAMKLGAYDFILKPFEPDHVALAIQKALEHSRLLRGAALVAEERDERYRLIAGKSPLMNQAIEVARKAAASRSTVLLLGESGAGKEIFARAIHGWSDRRQEPFIAINCVGLSRELLESELFGHEKGAFTGAHRLKKGKMELGHRGTRASRRGRRHLRTTFRPSSSGSSRSATSSASGARSRSRSTSASSRPPTVTWTRRSRRASSGRISTTG